MNADTAIVNIPLSKRGNINAQLDKYKRDQAEQAAAARKVNAAQLRADKAEAKVKLAELIAAHALIEAKAAKLGKSRADLVAMLIDWSKWQPANLIKLHAQWLGA